MKFDEIGSSWFTKGYIQKFVTLFVFGVLSVILAYIIERLCYSHVLKGVDAALASYVPANEISDVKRSIYNSTNHFGVEIIAPIFVYLFIMFLVVSASTRFNIIRSVTLEKAIRFGNAMEQLGLMRESEQINFIRSYKLPLYIAKQPLLTEEEKGVEAKPYVFAYNLFSSKGFLDAQSGRRQLCVDANELQAATDALYASLKLEDEPDDAETMKALQKKVVELEQERRAANRQLVENSSEINELKAENKKLANSGKGEEMREGKKKKSEQELALYAMIFAPAYRKLAEGKHESKDFTRAAFEKFFANELQASGRLHEQLKNVSGKEVLNKLPSNVFDAIWNNLKDFGLVNVGGAAPSGSLERLEQQFYPSNRR